MDDFSMRTLDAFLSPNTSDSSSDSEDIPEPARRTSHFVRESVMNAIVYNQGRRKGSQEADLLLQQHSEQLEQKFATDLEREREGQRRTVDKIKMDHRIETTAIGLDAKRHIDEARSAMLKYRAAFKYECEQGIRKTNALTSMHEQERQEMKEEHDYKVDHLYRKISKLIAEKTDDQDKLRQEYELAMGKNQTYIEMLENKLGATELRLGESERVKLGGQGCSTRCSETSAGQAFEAPVVDQTSLIQQLRRTNADQAKLILGLQGSVSKLGRQLTAGPTQGWPGPQRPMAYTMSQSSYQGASVNTFTPPPMAYSQQQHQQTLQRANGSDPQHNVPHASHHTVSNMDNVYRDVSCKPAAPFSHELLS
ncbi:MAG: hypothetical protein Q9169_002449 [Polycauliona sp. 2 TL-2023]